MASTRLNINGMTCKHCVAKVEKALNEVDGVWSASVDLEGGTADVDFDDRKAAPEALAEAVTAAGYEATVG